MNQESNNLPPLRTAEEIHASVPEFLRGDNWFQEEVEGDFLNFEKPYRPPRYTMERNGIPFADVGELHIISGKPGNGKTGLMSQLMTALLCGNHGNTLKREVPHKVRNTETGDIEEKVIPNVLLYIDTEQGEDDTIAIKNRVCSMAGIDYTKPCDQFYILRLRDTETAEQRWRKILKAIFLKKPTDIFLDGMLDIVNDYNDQTECQPIIRKCMMLATYYDASLWAVLHENPLVDKLVGTLGSITQRKVSEIFTVVKVKQSEQKENERRPNLPDIYFKVKQVKARGKDVSDWLFQYITNAGGWGQPLELEDNGARVEDPEAAKREQERKEADSYFGDFEWQRGGVTYTALEQHLKQKHYITSNRQIKKWFDIARENSIIYKSDNGKYFYNGLDKDTPDEVPESMFQEEKGDVPF